MKTVTVHRVPKAPEVNRVVECATEILLDGKGPWKMTPREWEIVERVARGAFTTKPDTAPKGGSDG